MLFCVFVLFVRDEKSNFNTLNQKNKIVGKKIVFYLFDLFLYFALFCRKVFVFCINILYLI